MEAAATPARATIGRRIRRARLELGMGQQEFARRLGVTAWSVTQWENERRRPSPANLDRLEQVTRKPIAWFLDGIPDEDL